MHEADLYKTSHFCYIQCGKTMFMDPDYFFIIIFFFGLHSTFPDILKRDFVLINGYSHATSNTERKFATCEMKTTKRILKCFAKQVASPTAVPSVQIVGKGANWGRRVKTR